MAPVRMSRNSGEDENAESESGRKSESSSHLRGLHGRIQAAYENGYRMGVEDERRRWQGIMKRFSEFPLGESDEDRRRVAAMGADDTESSREAAAPVILRMDP